MTTGWASEFNVLALRLSPGADLRQSLQQYCQQHQLRAGFMITAVGSLQQAALRYAGAAEPVTITGKFEIISLVGTMSVQGLHLHLGLADRQGQTLGGHLTTGCLIYTTAEIVIGASKSFEFNRKFDPQTGYQELVIQPRPDLEVCARVEG